LTGALNKKTLGNNCGSIIHVFSLNMVVRLQKGSLENNNSLLTIGLLIMDFQLGLEIVFATKILSLKSKKK